MDHTWGVGELNRTVDRILRRHFSDEVWVSGEIAGLDRPASGHVYLRLVDHDPARAAGRAPEAVLHVTLFESNKRAVNQQLQRAGIGRIGEGMQVRIRGSLELYPAQGRVQLERQPGAGQLRAWHPSLGDEQLRNQPLGADATQTWVLR